MRLGITYNLKNGPPHREVGVPGVEEDPAQGVPVQDSGDDLEEEFDVPQTLEALRQVFHQAGYHVFLLGADADIFEEIRKYQVEFVFNIAEGTGGRSREARIPAVLELLNIPYSGSDPLALALTLDKALSKRIAISLGIRTPDFWLLKSADDLSQVPDAFPLFVKPSWEGSSKGIRLSSKVTGHPELETEVNRILLRYPGNQALVEKYVPGRELTVGVIGNKTPRVLGIMEMSFKQSSASDFCYSLEVKRKWKEEVAYDCPAKLNPRIEKKIGDAALTLFKVLGLRDIARFDFRLDEKNNCHFLEVNPLPGLSPVSGDVVIMADKLGIPYPQLILSILDEAFSRYKSLSRRSSDLISASF